MNKFFVDYVDRLGGLHAECISAIDGLSQEALDWIPKPGMNSIGILIVHIVGAERYWLGDVMMKEPSGRNRDQEFLTQGLEPPELTHRLDGALAYVQESLEKFSLEDLTEIRISPRDGQEFTIGWALLHVLNHTALHLGHIEATRHMWEMRSVKI